MSNINQETLIHTYKWTPDRNTLPFNYLCPSCATHTVILEYVSGAEHECSNPKCPYKLKFA